MSMTTVEVARLIRDFMEQRSHVRISITKAKLDQYINTYENAVFKYKQVPARSEEQWLIGALLDYIHEEIRDDAFDDYEMDRAMEDDW